MSTIYRSALELAEMIREGQATSVQIVSDHLDQIKQHNDTLNAVVILDEEAALRTAESRDREAQDGHFRGPLHGVPMTIKEQYWLEGYKATINTDRFEDWVAPEDAVVVERLKSAGAVIMGKTNVPKELLDYQVWGDIYPEGKNPYDIAYSPGGSSGGSAAALASGMTPVELGGDFGGSIRIPSYFCDLYGLKPTENTIPSHGLIPQADDAEGHVFHMGVGGPMARTVEDMELIWKIIRGPHHSDRITPRIDWADPSGRQLSDFRVAWLDGWPEYEPSHQIKTLIHDFVDRLSQHGCQTENAAPGNHLHTRSLSVFMRLFGMVLAQELWWLPKRLMRFQIKNTIMKGMEKFSTEYKQGFNHSFLNYSEAMGRRAQVISEWEQYFEAYDLLVCPMSFGPAYERREIGTPITYEDKTLVYVNYCWPYVACFNATGHPAMNVPLGLDGEGLPVGVQIVGPYWSEPTLIHFAKLLSTLTSGFRQPDGYQPA